MPERLLGSRRCVVLGAIAISLIAGGCGIEIRVKQVGMFFPTSFFGYYGTVVGMLSGYASDGTRISE